MVETLERPETGGIPEDCHPKIFEIIDHWRSIHPENGLPGRQHFDPIAIPHLLPNIRLSEVHGDPPRFFSRLVGTAIVRAFDEDHTGTWYHDVFEGFERTELYDDFCSVLRDPRPRWRRGVHRLNPLKDFIRIERVLLPFASDGERVDLLLALMLFGDPLSDDR